MFEYLVGGMSHDWPVEDIQSQLNLMGEQGWELISTETRGNLTLFYFRRRKEADL